MSRTVMSLIDKFENQTDNTIESFNQIFIGSPILNPDKSLTVEIGDLDICGMRKVKLSNGINLVNDLNYKFLNITNHGYLYIVNGNEYYLDKEEIIDKYPSIQVYEILNSIESGKSINKHEGIKIERIGYELYDKTKVKRNNSRTTRNKTTYKDSTKVKATL